MAKPRPWPNNAKEARDRAAETSIQGIRALKPVVAGERLTETERLRREAIALMALQHIARLLQGQGAPILFDE